MENIEIICIGQALLDCIIKGSSGASVHSSVEMADSITLSPGGDAFNESVILSRLGHRVQIMCGLGRDSAGDMVTNTLKENSVNTEAIVYSGTDPTPVAALFVNPDGGRKSVNSPAYNVKFFKPDTSLLKGIKVVSLASLFRAPFTHPDTILSICRAAKSAGALVTADTKLAHYGELSLEDIKESLPYIDYIFPNETEAKAYTQKDTYSEMADVFLNYGVKNVIIKTGAKGCFVKNSRECFSAPAYKLEARDTTGAGDNFAAGFISSILQGRTLRDAVEFATGCSALCVQSIGAVSGVQNRTQVEEFIKRERAAKNE
ncbi:MAG: carbohydrate kinase family protein [Muricomes sp.]